MPESTEPGCYFGERFLLEQTTKQPTTVTVVSDEAQTMSISKQRFEDLFVPLEEMVKQGPDKELRDKYREAQGAMQKKKKVKKMKVKMEDFRRIGLLGCGGFG